MRSWLVDKTNSQIDTSIANRNCLIHNVIQNVDFDNRQLKKQESGPGALVSCQYVYITFVSAASIDQDRQKTALPPASSGSLIPASEHVYTVPLNVY